MSFSLTWPVFNIEISFFTTIKSLPPIWSSCSFRDSDTIRFILFLETAFFAIFFPTAIPTFNGESPFSKKISNSAASSFFVFEPFIRSFIKRSLGARFLVGSIKPWACFFPWPFFFLRHRVRPTFASFFGNRGFLPVSFFWADMFFLAYFRYLGFRAIGPVRSIGYSKNCTISSRSSHLSTKLFWGLTSVEKFCNYKFWSLF